MIAILPEKSNNQINVTNTESLLEETPDHAAPIEPDWTLES